MGRKKARTPARKAREIHALRRAAERYDVCFGKEDLQKIIGRLGYRQHVKAATRQSNDRTEFVVTYQGQDFWVVYSKRHKEILTFLPPGEAMQQLIEADEQNQL